MIFFPKIKKSDEKQAVLEHDESDDFFSNVSIDSNLFNAFLHLGLHSPGFKPENATFFLHGTR